MDFAKIVHYFFSSEKELKQDKNGCLFWCKDGKKCLPAKKVCDKIQQRADGSNEGGKCG
jgi:hypothetical protein